MVAPFWERCTVLIVFHSIYLFADNIMKSTFLAEIYALQVKYQHGLFVGDQLTIHVSQSTNISVNDTLLNQGQPISWTNVDLLPVRTLLIGTLQNTDLKMSSAKWRPCPHPTGGISTSHEGHIYIPWQPYGPLARYVKLRVAHAPGMPGTFSRYRGLAFPTCITARAWRTCRGACRDR